MGRRVRAWTAGMGARPQHRCGASRNPSLMPGSPVGDSESRHWGDFAGSRGTGLTGLRVTRRSAGRRTQPARRSNIGSTGKTAADQGDATSKPSSQAPLQTIQELWGRLRGELITPSETAVPRQVLIRCSQKTHGQVEGARSSRSSESEVVSTSHRAPTATFPSASTCASSE